MDEAGTEKVLEPLSDADLRELEDGTLGGYLEAHSRPPAFYGSDGHPYTTSVEMEQVGDLTNPWAGFLLFPRFARSGVGVVDHVETEFIWRGATPEEIHRKAGGLTLREVKELLEEAMARRAEAEAPEGTPPETRNET